MKEIKEFLENWKQRATEYYLNVAKEQKQRKQLLIDQVEKEYSLTKEEKLAEVKQPDRVIGSRRVLNKETRSWKHINEYPTKRSDEMRLDDESWLEEAASKKMAQEIKYNNLEMFEERLEKLLTKEVERKEAALIKRIEKKGGAIIEAVDLSIGMNGELNGLINCEKKQVEVTTIFAGGYNIQCLHYRVLVK